MDLHTHHSVTVEVLSPVHIGDGSELLRDIDYVTHRGQTYVVNQDALLDYVLGENQQFDDRLLGRPVSELLNHEDFEKPELFRYRMAGEPQNRPIRAQIKDVYGRPYLPGSTLKGLLRTMYVWGWFAARKQAPDMSRLGKSRSWAAQPLERDVMGGNPNEDLFRAVQIGDSDPVGLDRLRVTPVSIYPTSQRGGGGVVVDVEALREGTTFESRFSIEEYGFRDPRAAKRLGWEGKRRGLDRIAQFGRVFGGRRLAEEIDYFRARRDTSSVLNFYSRLVQIHEQLEEGQFLAQLGWGAGWNSKTLNDLLTTNEREFARLVQDYRLTRFWQDFHPGEAFPASRHLAQRGETLLPVGWVKVTVA
jgi:CRISPR-associated protein Csm5